MICLPTGAGKTIILSRTALHGRPHYRTLVLAHREELLMQLANGFIGAGVSVEVDQGNNRLTGKTDIVVSSVQSMVKRKENYDCYDFYTIIIDEAHRAAARSYREIISYFNTRLNFYYTATPTRLDKLGYSDFIDEVLYEKDIKFMVDNGYLCDIDCERAEKHLKMSVVKYLNGSATAKLNVWLIVIYLLRGMTII